MLKCEASHGCASIEMHGSAGRIMQDMCGIVEGIVAEVYGGMIEENASSESVSKFRTLTNVMLLKAVCQGVERAEERYREFKNAEMDQG